MFFRPGKRDFLEQVMKVGHIAQLTPEVIHRLIAWIAKKRTIRLRGVMKAYARFALR